MILNNVLGVEIPKCLVDILNISGFDSRTTLALLNTDNIIEFEEYLNENREFIAIYKDIFPFKFLPAHRMLIRNTSNYIDQLKNNDLNIEPG